MNEYFLPGSVPATNAPGSSATVRSEFASVAAAFDKLPTMAGNANEFVVINPSGTSLISSGVLVTDLATVAGVQTITNKTLSWAGNTWVGFGTGATKSAGTSAGDVLLLAENAKLPVLDGSNLTNLNSAQLGVVDIANGGTGAGTLAAAKTVLGIDLKADVISPALSGAPTCPTPGVGDNSSRLANTFFVNNAIASVGGMTPSNAVPLMDGVGAAGASVQASRADHVHPTDTSRAPLASPAFTGNPTAPTPALGDNDTSIATTAFVLANATTVSNATPLVAGTPVPGVSAQASRADHVHPVSAVAASGVSFTPAGAIAATNVQAALAELDTEKAPLASPTFTGNPTAPTPTIADNDTSIATTAFVQAVIAAQPAGMLPSSNTPLMDGVASAGVGVTGSRDDHVHPTDTSRAPLASPTFTGTVAGITKSMVGLGNVDNTSDATKNLATATLTNKTIVAANNTITTAASGTLASTELNAALAELASEKVQKTSPTGSALTPTGTSAQRDGSPAAGYFRFNTTLGQFEGYSGTAWGAVGGGATGGTGNPVFYENDTTVTVDYTVTAGKNAMSAGPITINSGVTVTVPSGSTWSIV